MTKKIDLNTWNQKIAKKEKEITQVETKIEIATGNVKTVIAKMKEAGVSSKTISKKIAELKKERDAKIEAIEPLLEELEE